VHISDLCRPLAVGLSIAGALAPVSASATFAYAVDFFTGANYVRTNFVDPPHSMGEIMLTMVAAFAADDYEHQYWIDEALGRLHRINTFSGASTLIGDIGLQDKLARGMHWDPVGQQMLLSAMDESCVATTLYRLDLTDASTVEIGSTPGCIGGLAIDAQGHAFGVDESDATLVSIDTATGEATPIGPLNLDMQAPQGLDFDPESGLLYVFGSDTGSGVHGMFLVDTTSGNATLVQPYIWNFVAISLAPAPAKIFKDGFDSPFSCGAGRIETSDVAYSDGTLSDEDITFFETLWGRSSVNVDPAPFPGSSTTVGILDFAMSGYVAAAALINMSTPEEVSGVYTYADAQTPDNPHIDFSISEDCNDFSSQLGECVAFDVAPDNRRLVKWSLASHDTPSCVLHAGRYYFLNVRVSDPASPSPACPGDVCAIRISSEVATP
jgi:hypothetical protein